MDLTLDNGPSMPISVPVGRPDRRAARHAAGIQRLQRRSHDRHRPGNPAQQINSITSYLDLSQVYGSDLATDNALRTFVGGQMKTSPGGLPPLDNSTYFTRNPVGC